MDRREMADMTTVFFTGYVKRWMESNYDRLLTTAPGLAVGALDKRARYALEAGLYGLLVLMDRKLPASSPVERLIKEVALDAPSEIAKRLINGAAAAAQPGAEKAATSLQRLLLLDEIAVSSLLTWFATLDETVRQSALKLFQRLDPGELLAFAALTPEVRNQFLSTQDVTQKVTKNRPSILHGLRRAIEQSTDSHSRER